MLHDHARMLHIRCACGWVGSKRGHGAHVSWAARRALVADHTIVAFLPSMSTEQIMEKIR